MSEREPLDAGLKSTDAALAALVPAAGRIDRDRLMYEAGRATAARSPWRQIATTSLIAVVALVVGRFSVPQAAPLESRSAIAVQVTPEMISPHVDRLAAATHEPSSVFQLRRGLDRLDAGTTTPSVGAPGPQSRAELLHELLN